MQNIKLQIIGKRFIPKKSILKRGFRLCEAVCTIEWRGGGMVEEEVVEGRGRSMEFYQTEFFHSS